MKLAASVMKELDFNVTVYVTVGLFEPLPGYGNSAKTLEKKRRKRDLKPCGSVPAHRFEKVGFNVTVQNGTKLSPTTSRPSSYV